MVLACVGVLVTLLANRTLAFAHTHLCTSNTPYMYLDNLIRTNSPLILVNGKRSTFDSIKSIIETETQIISLAFTSSPNIYAEFMDIWPLWIKILTTNEKLQTISNVYLRGRIFESDRRYLKQVSHKHCEKTAIVTQTILQVSGMISHEFVRAVESINTHNQKTILNYPLKLSVVLPSQITKYAQATGSYGFMIKSSNISSIIYTLLEWFDTSMDKYVGEILPRLLYPSEPETATRSILDKSANLSENNDHISPQSFNHSIQSNEVAKKSYGANSTPENAQTIPAKSDKRIELLHSSKNIEHKRIPATSGIKKSFKSNDYATFQKSVSPAIGTTNYKSNLVQLIYYNIIPSIYKTLNADSSKLKQTYNNGAFEKNRLLTADTADVLKTPVLMFPINSKLPEVNIMQMDKGQGASGTPKGLKHLDPEIYNYSKYTAFDVNTRKTPVVSKTKFLISYKQKMVKTEDIHLPLKQQSTHIPLSSREGVTRAYKTLVSQPRSELTVRIESPRVKSSRRQTKKTWNSCKNSSRSRPKAGRMYTIQTGDTLWEIARQLYRKGEAFNLIYRANRKKIRNPHLIYSCQNIYLPRRK
ncbi:MAG TPA: hypothetical protein TECP_00884 [Hyphomicrobiaceae bacterium MAG_BT-2024]